MKNNKFELIVLDPNKIYTYPGEACGADPPPGWVRPVKLFNSQPDKRSNDEEIAAVVETGIKLFSSLFWFGCLFTGKVLLALPDILDRTKAKREALRRKK